MTTKTLKIPNNSLNYRSDFSLEAITTKEAEKTECSIAAKTEKHIAATYETSSLKESASVLVLVMLRRVHLPSS